MSWFYIIGLIIACILYLGLIIVIGMMIHLSCSGSCELPLQKTVPLMPLVKKPKEE